MVVLFQQYVENTGFFSTFSAGGRRDGGTLLVIPLEFQEIEHQPLSMAQPLKNHRKGECPEGVWDPPFYHGSVVVYGCFIFTT